MMKICGMGVSYPNGTPLFQPLEETDFSRGLLISLQERGSELRKLLTTSSVPLSLRMEIPREPVDLGDPLTQGWTFLVDASDPQLDSIIQAIRPLAKYRKMKNPTHPLVFSGEPENKWSEWLSNNYSVLDIDKVPRYILIVGSADQVPFRLQSYLGIMAAVGRVDFDSLTDLETYIEKIIRLERSSEPTVSSECVFFAPDGGPKDVTHFSHLYMAKPLAEHVRTIHGLDVTEIIGDKATKEHLLEFLSCSNPALIYIASHGLGALENSLEVQKQLNGAICCQRFGNEPDKEWIFTAQNVPQHEPFLEGSVFFQFGCFTYGTPAQSDFWHWRPAILRYNTKQDFIAALPKKLLSHPHGPIAFVGHVDTAWLHGFADPANPRISDRWHRRIEPYVSAVNTLLKVQPCGLALRNMTQKYNWLNAQLVSTYDSLRSEEIKITDELQSLLADTFIERNDAQNYMIFGDPAARLRIPMT